MVEFFSGQIQVQYGQAYIELTGSFDGDMGGCFRGQGNGLCGAQVPAILFLVTGLHTGVVGIDIRLFDAEPALDEGGGDRRGFFLGAGRRDQAGGVGGG